MNVNFRLLIVNTGSTSTKIAVFHNERPVFNYTITHRAEELKIFPEIIDQLPFRKAEILRVLAENNYPVDKINAIIARGGLLRPLSGGTYLVGFEMVEELRSATRGNHASNLGGLIAYELAEITGISAFVVDPVTVDEMQPVARISGLPEIHRESIFHALNQKAMARRAAHELGQNYEDINLIVAHLGGGISIGAHCKGRVIDVNNAVAGDGPFSPERAGAIPAGGLVELCFSGYTKEEVMKKIVGRGGLVAHLHTNNATEVEAMITQGNQEAKIIYQAMAYQVAKAIGSLATVLLGEVDAVVITGGIANSEFITKYIYERVNFLAPVFIYPGEDEMSALALGGLRVLRGEEQAIIYKSEKGYFVRKTEDNYHCRSLW